MENTQNNGKGIASLILGLVGLLAWLLPLLGYPVSIVGLVLGCMSRKSGKNGMALAGIILSIIALVLTLINSILGVMMAMETVSLLK